MTLNNCILVIERAFSTRTLLFQVFRAIAQRTKAQDSCTHQGPSWNSTKTTCHLLHG